MLCGTRQCEDGVAMKRDDQFPVGARVLLRRSPYGTPGRVVRVVRGRVAVLWPGIYRLGLHSPAALVLAPEEEDRR
jgi:hypothetical protein